MAARVHLPMGKGWSACSVIRLMSPFRYCHNSGWASGNVAHPCTFAPGCLPAHCDLALNQIHDSGKHFWWGSPLFLSGSSCSQGRTKVSQEVLNDSVVGKNFWRVGKPLKCRLDMSFCLLFLWWLPLAACWLSAKKFACFDTAIGVAVWDWTSLLEEQCNLPAVNTPTFLKKPLPTAYFRECLLPLPAVARTSSVSSF